MDRWLVIIFLVSASKDQTHEKVVIEFLLILNFVLSYIRWIFTLKSSASCLNHFYNEEWGGNFLPFNDEHKLFSRAYVIIIVSMSTVWIETRSFSVSCYTINTTQLSCPLVTKGRGFDSNSRDQLKMDYY